MPAMGLDKCLLTCIHHGERKIKKILCHVRFSRRTFSFSYSTLLKLIVSSLYGTVIKNMVGISMAVPWLRLFTSTVGVWVQTLVWDLKIPHAAQCSQNKMVLLFSYLSRLIYMKINGSWKVLSFIHDTLDKSSSLAIRYAINEFSSTILMTKSFC